jgi:hypothetical protein
MSFVAAKHSIPYLGKMWSIVRGRSNRTGENKDDLGERREDHCQEWITENHEDEIRSPRGGSQSHKSGQILTG